jgi:hypothetical protein
MESPETFNDVIVDNILIFPTHPHLTYLVKPNPSYCNQKNSEEVRVPEDGWKQVRCQSKVRASF